MLRYVIEARLNNLSDEVTIFEGRKDLLKMLGKGCKGTETLEGKFSDIATKIVKSEPSHRHELREMLARVDEQTPPPIVSNCLTGAWLKIHRTAFDGIDYQPSDWKIRFGFRFAFCGFTRN